MVDSSGNTDLPYEIVYKDFGCELRVFKNEDPSKLFWHRDLEDRIVKLIHGDVFLQFDNEIPFKLEIDRPIHIEKDRFHRVIANKSFVVMIYK